MKTLAVIFCYQRPEVLKQCAESLFAGEARPDQMIFIDDGSGPEVRDFLRTFAKRDSRIELHLKPENRGYSDSALIAFDYARKLNPEFLYLIESDFVLNSATYAGSPKQFNGLDVVDDVLENTDYGRNCLGVVGYDQQQGYFNGYTDPENGIFVQGMRRQLGEDNVNRAVLYKDFKAVGKKFQATLQLVSNTGFCCYLRWQDLMKRCEEFPELTGYLARACLPQEDPNYPESGEYKRIRVVDDGMLSHGINLVWNRWALKHGIDREKYAAWLSIKPSIAVHHWQGGIHQ